MTTALLSAFLDNLTTVLLMVPITFLLADALDIDPIPLVLIEIFASNIGGTATLIGDPPNILIAGATDLSFSALHREPRADRGGDAARGGRSGSTSCSGAGCRSRPSARARVMELDARALDRGPGRAAAHACRSWSLTILVFFVHKPLHLEPATVALAGRHGHAARQPPVARDGALRIEWPTLFFFIGLFVMVGALEEHGAIAEVADGIADVTGGDRSAELLGILWVSGDRRRASSTTSRSPRR